MALVAASDISADVAAARGPCGPHPCNAATITGAILYVTHVRGKVRVSHPRAGVVTLHGRQTVTGGAFRPGRWKIYAPAGRYRLTAFSDGARCRPRTVLLTAGHTTVANVYCRPHRRR